MGNVAPIAGTRHSELDVEDRSLPGQSRACLPERDEIVSANEANWPALRSDLGENDVVRGRKHPGSWWSQKRLSIISHDRNERAQNRV